MLRSAVLFALALALVLVPTAAADPLASGGVGPDGLATDQTKPYYLFLTATQPEGPRPGVPEDDCTQDHVDGGVPDPRPPPRLDAALIAQAARIAGWRPTEEFSVSDWFPTCFAFGLGSAPFATGHVAYDFATGRYYVEAALDDSILTGAGTPLPIHSQAHFEIFTKMGGTSGVSTEADCEGCPPPP